MFFLSFFKLNKLLTVLLFIANIILLFPSTGDTFVGIRNISSSIWTWISDERRIRTGAALDQGTSVPGVDSDRHAMEFTSGVRRENVALWTRQMMMLHGRSRRRRRKFVRDHSEGRRGSWRHLWQGDSRMTSVTINTFLDQTLYLTSFLIFNDTRACFFYFPWNASTSLIAHFFRVLNWLTI